MKTLAIVLTALALLTGMAGAQTTPLKQIQGVLTFPPAPPIDATAVDNLGTIEVTDAELLWDTQNTLYFMNRSAGIMDGTLGFRFDYLRNSLRYPMQSFTNAGRIYVTDSLLINSTNITVTGSPALLSADRGGRVVLNGQNVFLRNSRIRAGDNSERSNFTEGGGSYSINNAQRYYDEPLNIIDEYWSTNVGTISLPFMSQGGVSWPEVVDDRLYAPFGIGYGVQLDVNPANFDGLTQGYSVFIHSNLQFQANGNYRGVMQFLFIQTNSVDNPQMRVFFPGAALGGDRYDRREIWLELSVNDTDLLTGQPITRYLYLTDTAITNATTGGLAPIRILENFNRVGYFQANNFSLIRSDVPFLPIGFEEQPQVFQSYFVYTSPFGNGRFADDTPNYVSGSGSWTIAPRDLSFAGFGTDFTQLSTLQDPTNTPGRVEITARDLNASFARVRGENLVSIRATNISDMTGFRVEAPNMNLALLSTNSNIVISNVFPTAIPRMNGTLQAWCGVWHAQQFVTNGTLFPNLPGLSGSNTVDWIYEIMVVQQGPSDFTIGRPYGDTLKTNVNVSFQGLTLNGPGTVLNDDITVDNGFLINGRSLYIPTTGALTLGSKVPNFSVQVAPNLVYLTNEGSITVPGSLNMGFDRSYGYSNIINSGTIEASSMLFRTLDFFNTGLLFAPFGTIGIDALTNRLAAVSQLSAGDNVEFSGRELALNNSFINAGGLLKFDLTEHLTDEGQTNFIVMQNGFDMETKPSKGDLLASVLYSVAQPNFDVLHFWSGEDRGDDPSGYLNNVALGKLTLDGGTGSRHFFFGTGVSNALYVGTLEFANNATNYADALYVDPSLTIYFAYTSPNVAPEKLTNAHPGRLIWVSPTTYQGPMLKVQASMSKTIDVAYRSYLDLFSAVADSDGDGIANKFDATPLTGFTVNNITMTTTPTPTILISWQSVAGYTYTVEYTTDLKSNVWQTLTGPLAGTGSDMTVGDPFNPVSRFYRVKYTRP